MEDRVMFNPQFDRVFRMVETLANKHVGEMETLTLSWAELKTPLGTVYQVVPLLDILYKG